MAIEVISGIERSESYETLVNNYENLCYRNDVIETGMIVAKSLLLIMTLLKK